MRASRTVMLVMQGIIHVMLTPPTTLAYESMQRMQMPGTPDVTVAGAHTMGSAHAMGPSMLVAHVSAALVMAVLLRRSEIACFAVVCLTGTVIRVVTSWARGWATGMGGFAPAAPSRLRPVDATDIAQRLHAVVLAAHVVRRGPPQAAHS